MSSEIAFNDDVLKINVPGYSKRDFAKLRRKQISLQPLFYPWFYQIKAVQKVFPHSRVSKASKEKSRKKLFVSGLLKLERNEEKFSG